MIYFYVNCMGYLLFALFINNDPIRGELSWLENL